MKFIVLFAMFVACGVGASANEAVLRPLNDLRASAGLAPVAYSIALEKAARSHARDMSRHGYFSHKGRDGSSVGDRARRAGYRWCIVAENIAKGQKGLASVMRSWNNSRGHRRNMLDRKIREAAVVKAQGDVWVMVLAARC